jgi:hypothetical protein
MILVHYTDVFCSPRLTPEFPMTSTECTIKLGFTMVDIGTTSHVTA